MLYKIITFLVRPLAKIIFPYSVSYAAEIPKEGPLILCGKHISLMDAVITILTFKRQVFFIAKAELFKFKPFGWFLRSMGAFPIKRGTGDLSALKTSLKILKEGKVLGIMPEGTRVQSIEHTEFKTGAMNLAYKTKAPVLPYGIYTKDYKVRPFKLIRINYGKPLTFEELGFKDGSKEELQRVTDNILKKEIIELSKPDGHKRGKNK